ncbi:putative motility protein [Devosia sp. YIM 151766]|uniref:putative motility protein n=1 Tax=Devosia sp. YIM 151766 TaxID=3017325 RepID=UPI00255C6A9D|nr:putative motility protein [Devosia sp. YIM 151766]WIY52642.1 putative motility protein [Devosia sp. YIM 151766]
MDIDLSMQMLAARHAATNNAVQIAVFKKAHEMQTELLETLMQTALSAPPPGQGLRIDKLA